MRFRIDLKIFILVILFLITNQIKIYAMIMLFAIIHEFGHLLAGILLGMKPEKIEIKPFGVSIDFNITRKDYNIKIRRGNLLEIKKIFVAFAGPVTNALIIIAFMVFPIFNFNAYDKMIIVFSNITLIIFNILPIYPLDGGRILKSMIYIFKGKHTAEIYIHIISYITLIMITVISSIAILYLKNIAIFLAIIFLWGLQIKEHMIYKNRKILYEIMQEGMRKCDDKNIKIPIENKSDRRMIIYRDGAYPAAVKLAEKYRKHGIACEVMHLCQGRPFDHYFEIAEKEGMDRICYFENEDLIWLITTETKKFEKMSSVEEVYERIEGIKGK